MGIILPFDNNNKINLKILFYEFGEYGGMFQSNYSSNFFIQIEKKNKKGGGMERKVSVLKLQS